MLRGLGFSEDETAETMSEVRRRDAQRLDIQVVEGITGGRFLLRGNVATPEPAPLIRPQQECKPLNAEAAEAIAEDERV